MTNSRRKEGMIGRTWYCPSPPHVIWLCTFAYYTAFWLLSKTYIYTYICPWSQSINHARRATYISIIHDQLSTMKQCVMNWHCGKFVWPRIERWETWASRVQARGEKCGRQWGIWTVQSSVCIEGCTSILAVEDGEREW